MPVQEELKIRVKWQGREADLGLERLYKEFQKIEQRTNQTNQGFGKLGGLGTRLTGIMGRLGPALVGAVGIAAAREIAGTVIEMSKLAAQSEITTRAFDTLAVRAGSTGPAELDKLRSAVGGTLSDLQLMQKVGAAVDAGLSFDQSRTALEFLRRYSLAFGKDFNQLTSTIFTGLQRGSTLMLDDAGIIIDASSDIYKGLSEVEKKSRLVADAIKLMGEKMETLPQITDNAITASDRLKSSWEKLKIAFGKSFQDEITGSMSFITKLLNDLANQINSLPKVGSFIPNPLNSPTFSQSLAYNQLLREKYTPLEKQALGGLEVIAKKFGYSAQKFQEEFEKLIRKFIEIRTGTKLRDVPTNANARNKYGFTPGQDFAFTRDTSGGSLPELPVGILTGFDLKDFEQSVINSQKRFDDFVQKEDERRDQEARTRRVLYDDLQRIGTGVKIGTGPQEVLGRVKTGPNELIVIGPRELIRRINVPTGPPVIREGIRTETDEERRVRVLGEWSDSLGDLSRAFDQFSSSVGTFFSGFRRITSSLRALHEAKSAFASLGPTVGALGGIFTAAGAAINIVSGLFRSGMSAAEQYAERQRAAEEATRRTAEALRQFETAVQEKSLRDLKNLRTSLESYLKIGEPGEISRSIQAYASTYAQLDAVNAQIAKFGGAVNTVSEVFQRYQHLVNIDAVTDPVQKMALFVEQLNALGQRVKNGGLFAYIDEPGEESALGDFYRRLIAGNASIQELRDRTEQYNWQDQKRIIEQIAQLERDIRQEQADLMIAQIEKQRRDVLEALSNAEEAQRKAALRAVELQFDFAEAEIRARYQPRFAGAGGDQAQLSVLREDVLRDIETLRARETGATESVLNQISKNFSTERDRTTALYDGIVKAIRDAVPDLARPFDGAVDVNTSKFMEEWTGEVKVTALPPALEETQSKILAWLQAQHQTPDRPDLPPLTVQYPVDPPTVTVQYPTDPPTVTVQYPPFAWPPYPAPPTPSLALVRVEYEVPPIQSIHLDIPSEGMPVRLRSVESGLQGVEGRLDAIRDAIEEIRIEINIAESDTGKYITMDDLRAYLDLTPESREHFIPEDAGGIGPRGANRGLNG